MINLINRFSTYFKNAGLYFISSIFSAIVGVLLNPLLAMNLSEYDYAILGYYSSFNLLLIPVLHFCLITYYARKYYFIDPARRERMGNTILIAINLIGLLSLLIFTIVFYLIYRKTNISIPFIPYAILTFVQLFISNNLSFYLTKLRIEREAKKYARLTVINCVVTSLFVVILVVILKTGALGKLVATLSASIIFAYYSFKKSLSRWEFDKDIFKESLKFGFPLTISALFWYFATGVDRVLLEPLGDNNMLGVYNVGISIAAYMQILFTTLSSTFEPDIYQSISENNTKKTLLIILIIVGVVSIGNGLFIICAPFLVNILTAGRYISSVPFVQILALSNILMACYYMIVKLLVGYGYVKAELFIRILGSLISLSTFWYLISKYQYFGAAWGQSCSFGVLSILGIIYLFYKRKQATNI